MQYDALHLPGPPIGGCGKVTITPDLGDDHDRGDRITIKCRHCGRVGEHEIKAPLKGLKRITDE